VAGVLEVGARPAVPVGFCAVVPVRPCSAVPFFSPSFSRILVNMLMAVPFDIQMYSFKRRMQEIVIRVGLTWMTLRQDMISA
jgi:hypothetical protein